jgi:hypothetical protein
MVVAHHNHRIRVGCSAPICCTYTFRCFCFSQKADFMPRKRLGNEKAPQVDFPESTRQGVQISLKIKTARVSSTGWYIGGKLCWSSLSYKTRVISNNQPFGPLGYPSLASNLIPLTGLGTWTWTWNWNWMNWGWVTVRRITTVPVPIW